VHFTSQSARAIGALKFVARLNEQLAPIHRTEPNMAPQASKPQPSSRSTPAAEPERTGAGEQHVMPGAERISDAELAKRRAEQPLKSKAEQKPADEGLFSDQSKQADLFDRSSLYRSSRCR
jgi:hypothetical protein